MRSPYLACGESFFFFIKSACTGAYTKDLSKVIVMSFLMAYSSCTACLIHYSLSPFTYVIDFFLYLLRLNAYLFVTAGMSGNLNIFYT